MEEKRSICEVCFREISNPFCLDCYINHVKSWLRDFQISKKKSKEIIKIISRNLPKETVNDFRCVICKKEAVSVCMYCAFLKTEKIFSDTLLASKTGLPVFEAFSESSNFSIEENKMEAK